MLSLLVAAQASGVRAQAGSWESLGPYGGLFEDVERDVDGRLYGVYERRLLVSEDDGRHWSAWAGAEGQQGTPDGSLNSLVRDPRPAGGVYGRFSSGVVSPPAEVVWRLLGDDGTWSEIPCGFQRLLFPPEQPGVVYCWGRNLAGEITGRQSLDGGRTWGSQELVPDEAFDGAPFELRTSFDRLQASHDGGRTFVTVLLPAAIAAQYFDDALAVDSNRWLLLTDAGLLRTTDAGVNWQAVELGLGSVWGLSAGAPGSGEVFLYQLSGLWRSVDDGQTWDLVETTVGTGVADVWPDPSDRYRLLAGRLESNDSGQSWTEIRDPVWRGFGYEQHPLDDQHLVERLFSPSLRRAFTRDGGRTWQTVPHPREAGLFGDLPCRDLRLDPLRIGGFYCLDANLFHTADFGETWRLVGRPSDVAPSSPAPGVRSRYVTISRDGTSLRVVREVFRSVDEFDVVESRDGGETWEHVVDVHFRVIGVDNAGDDESAPSLLIRGWQREVDVDPPLGTFARWDPRGGRLVVSQSAFVGRTTLVAAAPEFDDVLFLGTEEGRLYRSNDGGELWTELERPAGAARLQALRWRGTTALIASEVGVLRNSRLLEADCTPGDSSSCLSGSRFLAEVSYRMAPTGPSFPGKPVELTESTSAFWFFDEDNVEVVVKLVDGCAVNGHHWVYATGLTDVAVELVVTDTVSGVDWSLATSVGEAFRPVFDVEALPCRSPGTESFPVGEESDSS